jgi:hypothetical protein
MEAIPALIVLGVGLIVGGIGLKLIVASLHAIHWL